MLYFGYKLRKDEKTMKKLGKIEDSIEFINAILEGADVNEKKNGVPLVNYCFKKAMRYCGKCDSQQAYFDKLFYLLSSGADAKSLFGDKSDPLYYDSDILYKELLGETIIHLELLVLILNSQSCKDAIVENEIYWDKKADEINSFEEFPNDNVLKKEIFEDITEEKLQDLIETTDAISKRERKQVTKEQNSYLEPLNEIIDLLEQLKHPVNTMYKKYNSEL